MDGNHFNLRILTLRENTNPTSGAPKSFKTYHDVTIPFKIIDRSLISKFQIPGSAVMVEGHLNNFKVSGLGQMAYRTGVYAEKASVLQIDTPQYVKDSLKSQTNSNDRNSERTNTETPTEQ